MSSKELVFCMDQDIYRWFWHESFAQLVLVWTSCGREP